jgi:hypothetical protein
MAVAVAVEESPNDTEMVEDDEDGARGLYFFTTVPSSSMSR